MLFQLFSSKIIMFHKIDNKKLTFKIFFGKKYVPQKILLKILRSTKIP